VIEDIIAQSHLLVDTLDFQSGTVALSALRTIGDANARAGPFAQLLGVTFSHFGGGRCTATLQVRHHLLNPHGIAHGGTTFALADTACGGALLSVLGNPRMVTQDMQIRYHGPARLGVIEAAAEVVYLGKRTATIHCQVSQEGLLIATVSATYALLSQEELAELRPAGPASSGERP
jgi:acyl-CoA thioesterase